MRVSGADDDVLCPGWAMKEVPLPQRPLLALDDEKRFAGQHEKVLLVGFPVVDRHRRTRPEHAKEDADLPELCLTLEFAARRPALAMQPAGLASVQDEPSLPDRYESELGLLERRLPYHHSTLPSAGYAAKPR